MLENSYVEVEHAGKNEQRMREWGGLHRGFQFLIADWTGDSPFFDPLFSRIWYSPFFSPADWETEGRETQSIKKEGETEPLVGMQLAEQYKSPSISPKGDSGPQIVRVREKTRYCQPRNISVYLHKGDTWEKLLSFTSGEEKAEKLT